MKKTWIAGCTLLTALMIASATASNQSRGRFAKLPQVQRSVPDLVIEGEALVESARVTGGRVRRQSMQAFGDDWSRGAQLLWMPRRAGARLELTVFVPLPGLYDVAGYLTKGPDYGRFQLAAAGKQIGTFDGFGRRVVRSEKVALGTASFQRGENTLELVVTGKDPRSIGHAVGVDRLELAPVRAAAPPAEARGPRRARSDQPQLDATPRNPFAEAARAMHRNGPVVIEGEQLITTARATQGQLLAQPMKYFGRSWSGDAHLLWRASRHGARLYVTVDAPRAGDYTIAGRFTRAPDYGRFQLSRVVQKQAYPIGQVFDGFDLGVAPSEKIVFGSVPLEAGANQLIFEIVGKNRRSTGYFVGIDTLQLAPAKRSQAEFVLAVADARTLPAQLRPAQQWQLTQMARELRVGRTDEAKARWNHVVRGMTHPNEHDVDAMVQWVLREAYLEHNEDLRNYADKLRSYNQQKRDLRSTAGPDAPLANIDLQNHLQKQQETLQMMSNLSKMLHDTAMAVVRRIDS